MQRQGWTKWTIEGEVVGHAGRNRFRLRRVVVRPGQPVEVLVTLHPAAPPPLPPIGSWIVADCWRGILTVICESWEYTPLPNGGQSDARV